MNDASRQLLLYHSLSMYTLPCLQTLCFITPSAAAAGRKEKLYLCILRCEHMCSLKAAASVAVTLVWEIIFLSRLT